MSKKRKGGFLAGALVGAGLGLLFAPKKGSETRRELKLKIDDLTNKVKEIILNSVNKDPQLADYSVTGGVVDAYKAVQLAEEMYKKR